MTRSELEALIDGGDVEACIAAFQGMPEADRNKLGAASVARLRALAQGIPAQLAPFLHGEAVQLLPLMSMDRPRLASYRTARAAVLATASFSQWKRVKSRGLPTDDQIFRILSDRRPEWLGEFVEHICDEDERLGSRWPLIRRLVRDGYCGPPRSPRYIDRMLGSLPSEAWTSKVGLKDVLLGDPGLLEHEIWRIFETEPGPGSIQLISVVTAGARPELTWEVALTQLAAEGMISRARLLDACLDGLSHDLHDTRARWFAVLHDRLEPTPEELAERGDRYLDFLGSRNPSTVAFALKVVKDLLKAGRLDSAALVDRLAPALHARTKGTVRQALTLLDLAARGGGPTLRTNAAAVAAHGLVHEAADVQAAILDFIERYGDRHHQPLRESLAACLGGIAVSLRSRLETWLEFPEEPEERPVEDDLADLARRASALDPRLAAIAGVPWALAAVRGERSDLPALSFDGTEIPRLDPERRLVPIEDLDSLIERCSRLIENPEPAEEVDRCVDAISRLCDRRPADFAKRTAPLAARIRQRLGMREGVPAYRLGLFGLIVWSWLTEAVPDPPPIDDVRTLHSFLSNWVMGLVRRLARSQPAPLLAAPTHEGVWIDPHVFVERFRRRCALPHADEPQDLILAILRLAPDHRAEALADAREFPGEQGAAIRYALGSHGESIGPTAALWVAAARARWPWTADPAVEDRHPALGPDAGRAATYHIDGNEVIPLVANVVQLRIGREPAAPEKDRGIPDLPTVAFHSERWLGSRRWPSPASLWPAALESVCAFAARLSVESSEASSDWQENRGFLLPLLDPDVPLRPMARLLLAVALNAKLAEIAGLASDALIAAVDDGRLDADTLGESLRIVWQLRIEMWIYRPVNDPLSNTPHTVPLVKPSRWTKALGDVARASPLHASVIARAVEKFLVDAASESRTAASLLPFLELVRETSVETGRAVSPEARAFFGGLGTAGKTGRVVKHLLALRDMPAGPAMRQARMQALARHIERAERWMKWERSSGR